MPTLRTYAKPVDDTVMVKIPKEYSSYSFQVILVPYKVAPNHKKSEGIHIFDALHSDWGGTGSPDEIAESIRTSRHFDRQSMTW